MPDLPTTATPWPEEPDELGELSCDRITQSYHVWQRKRGHRYSLDDVLTAYEAARAMPDARHCLELGSGIGSVLHMLAERLPHAHFVAIEAQRNSFALLTRNVQHNGLQTRTRLIHGDLREQAQQLREGTLDLITGTPPYVPPGQATPSPDAQRAFARQEFRGGVEDYIHAGASMLSEQGRFVVCADARFPARVERAAHARDLRIERIVRAIPRAGRAPLFSVFVLRRAASDTGAAPTYEDFVARDAVGARTQQYLTIRAFFGLLAPEDEAPSP